MQPKFTTENIKNVSPSTLLKLILHAKNYIKKNDVYIKMCKDHNVDRDVIDLIPVKFGDLPVSARTEKGVITLNYKLLIDGDFFKKYMYLIHEIEHYFAQSYGEKPTPGSNDGDYLHNPAEQDAFSRQIEYIDNIFGENSADNYADQLLDHHDKDGKERKKLKKVLMENVDDK